MTGSVKCTDDVVIIGGGPAGSTAAAVLAGHGHRVTLFEKEKFPREHVGESLLPFCYGLFEKLGLLGELKARFVRKPGVRFVHRDGSRLTTWCFNSVIKNASHLSFQVIRSEFDALLLENAKKLGADVKEQARVEQVDLKASDGAVVVKASGPNGCAQTRRARFLLDASGRSAFLANHSGWRKRFEGLDRTALWTHWQGARLTGGLEEGLSLIVYLSGGAQGWIWIFPLGQNQVSVGVVLDNEKLKSEKGRLQQEGSRKWRKDLYYDELMSSPFVKQVLKGARMVPPLRCEGDYSYYVETEHKYGDHYALIGDASTFIDPIFSSGIYLSMMSSSLVSEAVHDQLTSINGGRESMLSAYKRINGAYKLVYKLIQLFYNPGAVSFAEAGALGSNDHLNHEHAMAAGHYLLAGDFFDRHQEYLEFFAMLEKRSTFEKFKNIVIERSEFQADSCQHDRAEIFPFNQASGPR